MPQVAYLTSICTGHSCLCRETILWVSGRPVAISVLHRLGSFGERVRTRSDSGEIVECSILDVWITKIVEEIVELRFSDSSILRCTPDHPIQMSDGSYKEAVLVVPSDRLCDSVSLESNEFVTLDIPEPVYDISVDHPNHNFSLWNGVFLKNCWPPRPNAEASKDVIVNGRGWHRVRDAWKVHCCGFSCHASVLCDGSKTVQVNGRRAGRIGDPVCCGSRVMTGSPDVICGG